MTRPRARLIAFLALLVFGGLQWIRMFEPSPTGRMLPFLVVAAVAALALRWADRLAPRQRIGATAGVAVVLLVAALLFAGIPVALVEPRGWGDLVAGLGQGLETLPSMRIPYRGAEMWARDTLLLLGMLLAVLATVLACRPRGRERFGHPIPAAVAVGVLVGVPAVSLESESQLLIGLVFAALLIAFLRIDRIRPDARPWAAVTVAGVLLLALALAPRVDADRPLLDYEAIARSVSKRDGASFNWSHGYGPLNWPRTGRELLRVKTERALYWKATNLVQFDGVRWTTGWDRWLQRFDSSEVPSERDRWRHEILVTVRGLRTTQVIGAGSTLSISDSPRPVRETGPGRFETVGAPLASGHAYRAEVYVPAPSRRALADAPTTYPTPTWAYLSMALPTEVGGPPSFDGSASFAGSRFAPRVRFAPWGSTAPPELDRGFTDDTEDATPALMASRYARTWELSRRLLAQSSTPAAYVRRVQDYLSDGFGYSETPRESPVPIDTFLFEEKAGYCQQFSGAMALLLRMAGIPARIAAGFSPGTLDEKRGEMVVRDIDAHSWVEAYFPTIGWVTFDPTPAESPARGREAEEEAEEEAAAGSEDTPTPALPEGRPFPGGAAAGGDGSVVEEGSSGGPPVAPFVALALLLAAAGAGLWLRSRRLARLHAAAGGDPTAIAVDELHRALRRTRRRVTPDMTLHSLASRFAGTAGEGYLRQLAASRYGTAVPPPDRAQRAGLRRALAADGGIAGKLRSLWALPPAPPSLRRPRRRSRRD